MIYNTHDPHASSDLHKSLLLGTQWSDVRCVIACCKTIPIERTFAFTGKLVNQRDSRRTITRIATWIHGFDRTKTEPLTV